MTLVSLQQALKVACSSKLPSESRTWISAYTAAVLAQLLRVQINPQPLCHLVIDAFHQAAPSKPATASPAAAAEAGRTAGSNAYHAEHAGVLSLPVEAQPLASLLRFAEDLLKTWHNLGRPAASHVGQPPDKNFDATPEGIKRSSKKRRKASQTPVGEVSSGKKQKSGSAIADSLLMPIGDSLQVRVLE